MTGPRTALVPVLATAALALALAAPAAGQRVPDTAVARMAGADGAAVGRVDLLSLEALFGADESGGSGGGGVDGGGGAALTGRVGGHEQGAQVVARLHGLPPGFHGFHVHATGSCAPPSFASAGGHFDPAGGNHPNHAGDMPVLYVNGDGTATASFFTDRFGLAQLFDVDGSAIVVHANADNFANIPPDRYDPDPDATTLATGDAGARIACGVVSRGRPQNPFPEDAQPAATAQLRRFDGARAGEAVFVPFAGKIFGVAFVERIAAGFHGLHLHERGRCDRPSFESAGGHLNPTGAAHGGHAGDLPVVYVAGLGRERFGLAIFQTDRFRIADLVDGDGSAILVHANPDNYANIPTDRYDPDPDATTLATGDAGRRIACGVVRRLVRCTVSVSPGRLRAGERTVLRVRVRSGGRPTPDAIVLVRGPGFASGRVTNARGVARLLIRPQRPGRLRVRVEPGVDTLGCSTSRPILGGAGAALTGRAN